MGQVHKHPHSVLEHCVYLLQLFFSCGCGTKFILPLWQAQDIAFERVSNDNTRWVSVVHKHPHSVLEHCVYLLQLFFPYGCGWLRVLPSLVGVGVVAIISCLIIISVRIHTRGLLITPSVCILYVTEPTSAQNQIYIYNSRGSKDGRSSTMTRRAGSPWVPGMLKSATTSI